MIATGNPPRSWGARARGCQDSFALDCYMSHPVIRTSWRGPRRDGLLISRASRHHYKHQSKRILLGQATRRMRREQLTLLDTQTTNAYESFALGARDAEHPSSLCRGAMDHLILTSEPRLPKEELTTGEGIMAMKTVHFGFLGRRMNDGPSNSSGRVCEM